MSNRKFIKRNSEWNRTDSEWARKIRAGDTHAFENLFRKYYKLLYYYIWSYVKNAQIAEDIVQDVFLKIWLNRKTLHISSSVKSYLYTAVKNRALDNIKRTKIVSSVAVDIATSESFTKTPGDELNDQEIITAVHKTIDELPKRCRQIFKMKKYDGLSYTEIADILEISTNTVQTQMTRAFKYLRKHLSNFFPIFPL
jgi:RNA polymerase sigma-70 factor (ECF subfamily)